MVWSRSLAECGSKNNFHCGARLHKYAVHTDRQVSMDTNNRIWLLLLFVPHCARLAAVKSMTSQAACWTSPACPTMPVCICFILEVRPLDSNVGHHLHAPTGYLAHHL